LSEFPFPATFCIGVMIMSNFQRMLATFTFVVLTFGAGLVNEANGQIPEILKRMDDHQRALSSLKASVMMDKHNSQLDERDVSEGTAMYVKVKDRDALVRIDWVKPEQSVLSVVNRQYVLFRPRLNQAIVGNADDAQKNTKSAGAFDFLKMSKEQLKQNFSVKYFGQEKVSGQIDTWKLELTPKTARSYKSIELWVDGNGMVLQTKVNEANGDSTTVLLSSLSKNTNINAAQFKVNLPKNVQIIKG